MVLLTMAGMTIATLVALGYPLLNQRDREEGETAVDELTERKEALFREMGDLEFDRDTGKVAAADYESLRAGYEREAALVLEAMDRKGNGRKPVGRAEGAGNAAANVRFCPHCGHEVVAGDRFCGDCGRTLDKHA